MKKTLGGDRLGSGKKNEVELHNYGRSTHDKGYLWRSTMAAGTLVPFMTEIALPGDTFDINLDCDVKTHPTVGPLFGSFKVQLDIFLAPIRLYQGALHNNKLGIGLNMAQIKLPTLKLKTKALEGEAIPTGVDNSSINPSSIFAYLGIRGVGSAGTGVGTIERTFQGLYWLAYWDAYKNYYANKQEEIGAVIHRVPASAVNEVTVIEVNGNTLNQNTTGAPVLVTAPDTITITYTTSQPLNQLVFVTTTGNIRADELGTIVSQSGTETQIEFDWARYGNRVFQYWRYVNQFEAPIGDVEVATFPLADIDNMREAILSKVQTTSAFEINTAVSTTPDQTYYPWSYALEESEDWYAWQQPQEGLALKTYQSDLFNNWISTEWIDGENGINEITAVDTTGDNFTINALQLSNKVYDMLNRVAVSGGSYDDWLTAVYAHERTRGVENPMYLGGLIRELGFQEVISNAASVNQGEEQALGTLAGRGVLTGKNKGGKIKIRVDEPSYIIGIASLTPKIDYSQGNKWDVNLKTMDDFHKPGLDEIGFQDAITDAFAYWSTEIINTDEVVYKSAGKQPAWINYMTNVNQVRGNFAIEAGTEGLEGGQMYMTLNRRYEQDGEGNIKDLTTYIDPSKYNNIFADTRLDAQNFWTQIGVNITARRKMSAKLMPNL